MRAVFVLLPATADLEALLPDATAARAPLRLRRYPRASDRAHLLSLVRDGRDPIATRWVRGTVLAIGAGGVLGLVTMGVVTHVSGAFGGLFDVALGLGFGVGAFLGGFTAAMTGTQVARDELKRLADEVQPGDALLQWTGEAGALAALAARCRAANLRTTAVD
jgi:hypothetical protein